MKRRTGYGYTDNTAFEEFEKKYEAFLTELAVMPRGSKEERDARYAWFQARADHDDIIMEAIKVSYPKAYRKLLNPYGGSPKDDICAENAKDDVIEDGEFVEGMDPLVFTQMFQLTIQAYSGQDSHGERVLFLACVKQNYKQSAQKESGKAVVARHGLYLDRPERNLAQIGRLVKSVTASGCKDLSKLEELVEEQAAKHYFPYTKEDVRLAKELVWKLSSEEGMFEALDASVDGEDGDSGETRGDFVSGSQEEWYEGEDTTMVDFLSVLTENLEENLKVICGITGKVDRDILKAFLTKDILLELKLKALPEGKGNITPEPKCRQWCHRAGKCPEGKKEGCFVRYDAVRTAPPYGDEDLYRLLEPVAKPLYTQLLHPKYLDAALCHENFEDVYGNKLYPNAASADGVAEGGQIDGGRCFDFSDAALARALGKDKGQISNCKKKYEREWRKALYQVFSQIRG